MLPGGKGEPVPLGSLFYSYFVKGIPSIPSVNKILISGFSKIGNFSLKTRS